MQLKSSSVMAGTDLDTLMSCDLPEGRSNLLDSYSNLERVAEYCESNYFGCDNKRAALEETKGYTTQSLASVAYQINTLAYNFLQMLDLQGNQMGEMESQVNHIAQTVAIHKEKVARREIGILTTNKSSHRQYKIIAPANPERPVKYVRKKIDYSVLDDIGHGVKISTNNITPRQKRPSTAGSQYAPGLMGGGGSARGSVGGVESQYGSIGNVNAAGPAPTTKPPTPPQNRVYSSGTLQRGNKEYRTPPIVAPPQVPSNYAPNYPIGSSGPRSKQQYGTLPHPHHPSGGVATVHPVQQMENEQLQNMRVGGTMPRLSSSSMRSTASSSAGSGADPTYGTRMQYGSSTLGRQSSSGSQYSRHSQYHSSPPINQYGVMNRPTQRPPSPPLPPPPNAGMPPRMMYQPDPQHQLQQQQQAAQQQLMQQQQYQIYAANAARAAAAAAASEGIYSRQNSSNLSRQSSGGSSIMRQSSLTSGGSGGVLPKDAGLPGWVPKNYIDRVTAIYDYTADKEDELSFSEAATIYVLKKNDDGWWEGVMDGITGLFPGNYVESCAK